MTVYYFAAARAAAGVRSESVTADSVDQALKSLRSRHDERFAGVLAVSSLLLDGRQFDNPQADLGTDARLDVLPPFAGG